MGFDKAIRFGKEFRKPYRRAKAIDPTCRNHGGCPYCENQRLFRHRKAALFASYDLRTWRLDAEK